MALLNQVAFFSKYFAQSARLMCGLPDYDQYVAHMKERHPDQPFMTYEEFFRNRQAARYGEGENGAFRCC